MSFASPGVRVSGRRGRASFGEGTGAGGRSSIRGDSHGYSPEAVRPPGMSIECGNSLRSVPCVRQKNQDCCVCLAAAQYRG